MQQNHPSAQCDAGLREIAADVQEALSLAEEAAGQFTRDEDAEHIDKVVSQLRLTVDKLRAAGAI